MDTPKNPTPWHRLTAEEVRALTLRVLHAALHAAVYWVTQHGLNSLF